MANTYSWSINSVDVRPTENSLSNVIYNVHWTYTGQDTNGNAASIYGSQSIAAPDSDSFIAFDDVTSANVITWLEAEVNLTEMKSSVDAQINEIVTPTTENRQLNN